MILVLEHIITIHHLDMEDIVYQRTQNSYLLTMQMFQKILLKQSLSLIERGKILLLIVYWKLQVRMRQMIAGMKVKRKKL